MLSYLRHPSAGPVDLKEAAPEILEDPVFGEGVPNVLMGLHGVGIKRRPPLDSPDQEIHRDGGEVLNVKDFYARKVRLISKSAPKIKGVFSITAPNIKGVWRLIGKYHQLTSFSPKNAKTARRRSCVRRD